MRSKLLTALLVRQLQTHLPPGCVVEIEHAFHPTRRWRFDVAVPEFRVAVEIEGGIESRGRHLRPLGFAADLVKYAQATVHGWRLLRVSPVWVENGHAASLVLALVDPDRPRPEPRDDVLRSKARSAARRARARRTLLEQRSAPR